MPVAAQILASPTERRNLYFRAHSAAVAHLLWPAVLERVAGARTEAPVDAELFELRCRSHAAMAQFEAAMYELAD